MKLLFVIGSMQGGGAEHVLATICNNFVERGHNIILVYDFQWKDYYISDKVRQIDAMSFCKDTTSGVFFKRYYNKFANRFRAYRFFSRFIKDERPDAVTCFLQNWAWQLAFICRGKVPLVYSERNTFDWDYKSFQDVIVKKLWYKMGDAVTVMTYYDKAYLHDRYRRIFVMHNPLSYTPIKEEEFIALFSMRKNILACGRLVEDKGFDHLIAAFAKIAEDFPEWNIDIAGKDMQNSHYSDKLKQMVRDKGLENRIHFIGFHHNMDVVMKQYSIFCLCSRHEGFPNVLSEALSMGMAVVSYDIVTGPREIIVDGLDGIIVENQNIEALSDALKVLMSNTSLRYKLGLKAIENITRFTPQLVIDRWEGMYHLIVSQK